jgi:murein DD-endopeptidase MepM/ murein hydrolase activator NlpD
MRPAVNACLAVAALSALSGAFPGRDRVTLVRLTRAAGASSARPASSDPSTVQTPCPPGTLPDSGSCIPFDDIAPTEGVALEGQVNSHHDRHGRLQVYEQIPRRPERPEPYERYRYPIPTADNEKLAISGFDLDMPDDRQRRGRHLKAVGHGGVDLAAPRGTEVHALPLEHQEGDAEVLHVGQLFGLSVVTRHAVREGGRLRDYILIHGHLDGAAPGLQRGARAPEGALLGYVGDSGSAGVVHLHLEIRRVRDGIDTSALQPGKFAANDQTIAVDPRNLLPLRP